MSICLDCGFTDDACICTAAESVAEGRPTYPKDPPTGKPWIRDDRGVMRDEGPEANNPLCSGWEVVCPDGVKRHYPYHNYGDAKSHAEHASDPKWFAKRECRLAPKASKRQEALPKCSGGEHMVRPIMLAPHPAPRGQS